MIAPFAHVGGVPVEEMIPAAAAGAGGALALSRAPTCGWRSGATARTRRDATVEG